MDCEDNNLCKKRRRLCKTDGRGLPRPVAHHLLRTLHQPRHQDRYGPHAERGEESRRVRLLAPVALQPRRRGCWQERLPPRLEGARLEQVPRLHYGRGPLQLPDEDLPPGGRRTLRRHGAQRQTALRRLQETERDVNLHHHTKTTKAETSNGLGFQFANVPQIVISCLSFPHIRN